MLIVANRGDTVPEAYKTWDTVVVMVARGAGVAPRPVKVSYRGFWRCYSSCWTRYSCSGSWE